MKPEKNIDLKYLEEYKNLTELFINGQIKNIESIKYLTNLTYLSLSISSKASISFINNLPKLKTLKFILGGRSNLDEITNYSIEELEIIRVRGFNKFDNISNFTNFKKILIEDQIQLERLSFQNDLPKITDLKLLNCKNLKLLSGIFHLKNLYQLRIYKTSIDFDKFIMQKIPKSLKILAFYTAKKKIDKIINEKLKSLGYSDGLNP